jgi:acid phosphatase type 7
VIKKLLLSSVSLILLTVACQQNNTPNGLTAPEPEHTFVIYGDTRTGHTIHQQIVNLIMAKSPEAVFHVGDMTDNGDLPSEWVIFDNITRALQDSTEFFPCMGNHEHESPLYFQYFNIPESMRYYSVNRFGIHFTIMDSNWPLTSGTDQYNWVKNDLENSAGDFNIVLLHHPFYSASNAEKVYNELRDTYTSLFQQHNVKIVFYGHEHNYERFYIGGIYYICTGGGGAPLTGQLYSMDFLQLFLMSYNFCYLTYDGVNLDIKVYDNEGKEIDSFSFLVNE